MWTFNEPWQCTAGLWTWDCLYRWQIPIAGLAALAAAAIAVLGALGVDRLKARRHKKTLRKSIALELRLLANRAVDVHYWLRDLSHTTAGPITARHLDSLTPLFVPTVYPPAAHQIGLLKTNGAYLILFYSMLAYADARLTRLMTNDDTIVDPGALRVTANHYLDACQYAQVVIPNLRSGVAVFDDHDQRLLKKISDAISAQKTGEPEQRSEKA